MISTAVIFIIFVALASLLCIVHYVHNRIFHGRVILLICLRASAITLLILAFFEPSLHFNRFSTDPPSIAVLVDESRSMRLFSADSLARQLRVSVDRHRKDNRPWRVRWFAFGDSLRPLSPSDPFFFNDNRSVFMPTRANEEIRRSSHIVIFSDGNWHNSNNITENIEQIKCFFVTLPPPAHQPFLRMTAVAHPDETPLDSTAIVTISLHGYKRSREPVQVACAHAGKQLWSRSFIADTGFFTDTILSPLPSSKSGTFIYTVTAQQSDDSLATTSRFFHLVIPNRLIARIHGSQPSLDKRFLLLALARQKHWQLDFRPDGPDTTTVVFFMEWNEQARARLERLPPSATAVFVGCLPCKETEQVRPETFSPFINPEYSSDSSRTALQNVPPPAAILRCRGSKSHHASASLSARITIADNRPDTIPLLFEQTLDTRRILVLALSGLWQWDFWPVSLDNQQKNVSFSDFFLDRVCDLARSNMNRSMYLYPERMPVYETDSIAFKLVLPADLHGKALTALRLSVTAQHGDTLLDSTYNNLLFGAGTASFAFGQLSHGVYRYDCSITWDGGSMRFGDSLDVIKNDLELMVTQQNTVMLGSMAQPIQLNDTLDLPAYIETLGISDASSGVRRQVINIRQSTVLLLLVLAAFATEWFLRKIWRFE